MRAFAPLILVCAFSSASHALPPGIPDPFASFVVLSPPSVPCQYRFRADGALDDLVVTSTVLDEFLDPVVGCAVTVTLLSIPGSPLCVCPPCNPQVAVTGPGGVAAVTFSRVGGRGLMTVDVVACAGIPIAAPVVAFTSTDLNGSCEPAPASATTIIDLGIFASALPPGYALFADFNCSGPPVNVVDLGMFAGGLAKGCTGICP